MPSRRKAAPSTVPPAAEPPVAEPPAEELPPAFDEVMAAAAQEEMAQMAADADTERAAAGEPPLHADAEGGGSSPGLEHGTAPLADDFTAEELAARSKQPESARAVSSNNQYYGTPVKKWWAQFCAKAKWDPVQKMQFLDVAGNPIDGTFRQFFVYLYEQDGMTKGVFKPCLQWAQAELNTQRENRLLAPMKAQPGPAGHVLAQYRSEFGLARGGAARRGCDAALARGHTARRGATHARAHVDRVSE